MPTTGRSFLKACVAPGAAGMLGWDGRAVSRNPEMMLSILDGDLESWTSILSIQDVARICSTGFPTERRS